MSEKTKKDPTNQEILEAIIGYASENDQHLREIRDEIHGIQSEIGGIQSEMVSIKSQMVTRDYLDDKLMDLRGDLIVLMRQGDAKLMRLVNHLANKKVIAKEFEDKMKSLEPFARASV